MRNIVFGLAIAVALSGCETTKPRADLPVPGYNGKDLEFVVISGYTADPTFAALGKSGWVLVASVPGYSDTYPNYVLMRKK